MTGKSRTPSPANPDVLAFYRSLPFNYRGSLDEHVDAIGRRDPLIDHPPLEPLVAADTSVLDVGCGVGWFSNAVALHRGSIVTGIDFNPVAIDAARAIAKRLRLSVMFELADLFLFEPTSRFDIVVALGVLHHTNNCHQALQRLCQHFARPGGYVYVGLYHAYGRRPFADHFAVLKSRGLSETELLAEYRSLHGSLSTSTHLLSWFRDQVMHPKETHHTLDELLPVIQDSSARLVATSINRFERIESLSEILEQEHTLEAYARKQLQDRRFYPGFFTMLLQTHR